MIKFKITQKTGLSVNESNAGKPLERKIAERLALGEKLDENQSPLLYTDKRDGVIAGYDPRTDRFEVALDAKEKVEKSKQAKRDAQLKVIKDDDAKASND